MFADRFEAGRRLAEVLEPLRDEEAIVLALPRGGVPVGVEIAQSLGAPLDVLVARKLGAPGNPELGIGAIAEGGTVSLDPDLCYSLGLRARDIERVAAYELRELDRRVRRYRGSRPLPDVQGRTVILVDDGIATGGTMRAAVGTLRRLHVARLVVATPVAATQPEGLRALVDDFVCLEEHAHFGSVGRFYRNFTQVSDEEVLELLARAHMEAHLHQAG
jgi:putative phosphoribosyl transferase